MRSRLFTALVLALATAAGPVRADPPRGDFMSREEARSAASEGRFAPMRDILAAISARYPGRPLGAPRLQRGQPTVYVIDWLTQDGRKLTVVANAETGQILNVSG